ncbi:MAG: hypothetical protein V7752_17490 [Halopseudomonas sp.]
MNDSENLSQLVIQGSMLEEQRVITDCLDSGVDEPQLLLWQYDKAAVIMGCSQRPDEGQLQRAETAGLPIIRRGSGGGAVLAGPWMLSATLFIPTEHPIGTLDLIKLFGWFEQIWIQALTDCAVSCKGVDKTLIDLSKQISKRERVEWACYASLSHGEVVSLDGRKLVGLAQIRKRKGVALVSGLHLQPCDWRVLCDVVVDDTSQAGVLESLNSNAEQLSGVSAADLLPQIIRHFTAALRDEFEVLKFVQP